MLQKKMFLYISIVFLGINFYSYSQKPYSPTEFKFKSGSLYSKTLQSTIENELSYLFTEFNKASANNTFPTIDGSKILIDEAAKQNINSLWNNSPFYCIDSKIDIIPITKMNGTNHIFINGIRVVLKNNKDKIEEAELEIECKYGKIMYFCFTLKNTILLKINHLSETDSCRIAFIEDFLMNVKNYYCTKNIKEIEKVYSEDAIIITGKVLERKAINSDGIVVYNTKSYTYCQYTKKEYLLNLTNCFNLNEYVKVDFDSIEISKPIYSQDSRLLTLRLKQFWNSTTYSDIGYLFLVIQFYDNPIYPPKISVRTWFQERDLLTHKINKSDIPKSFETLPYGIKIQ